jgi:hypothetical protein
MDKELNDLRRVAKAVQRFQRGGLRRRPATLTDIANAYALDALENSILDGVGGIRRALRTTSQVDHSDQVMDEVESRYDDYLSDCKSNNRRPRSLREMTGRLVQEALADETIPLEWVDPRLQY